MGGTAYSEAEYSILRKKITSYSEFLSQCISDYMKVIAFLREEAIHDEQITIKLMTLESKVSLYTGHLEEINSELAQLDADFVDELQSVDYINVFEEILNIANVQEILFGGSD